MCESGKGKMDGGKWMDNFMDKSAQKFNAQDMIRANSHAEAMEMKRLEAQVEEYERILQDVKRANLKSVEMTEVVKQLAAESLDKLDNMQKESVVEDVTTAVEEIISKSDEYVHTECVKVYSNVQAVVNDGFEKNTEKLVELEEKVANQNIGMKPLVITTMVFVVVDILINVLQIIGIF